MSEIKLPHSQHSLKITSNMQKELTDMASFSAIREVFQEFQDLTCIQLFWLMSHQEICVVNAASVLQISESAAVSCLHRLYERGLIQCRIEGKEVLYAASNTPTSQLLHEIMEQIMDIPCPEREVDYDATTEEIVKKVHAYLMENLDSRITIEALSKMFLMNTTTLKREFKKVYGTSIAAHMKQHRMETAAKLLLTTADDISSVARAVGYESQSRFASAFKDIFGQLPTEYRKGNSEAETDNQHHCV